MDAITIIKAISQLAYPAGLIGLCFLFVIVCVLLQRKAATRLFISTGITLYLLSSNLWIATQLMQHLENHYPQQHIENIPTADAILVLGGGLRLPIAPRKNAQLVDASDRYWHATQLFKANKAPKIILSGGNVYQQPGLKGESYYAAKLLREWGIPEQAILFEDTSRTTKQNAERSAKLLAQHNIKTVLLVTSGFHMPRSMQLFTHIHKNVQFIPSSSDTIVTHANYPFFYNLLPNANAFAMTTSALHEYYGVIVNYLTK